MAVMGFARHPGPFPIRTVREMEKWMPRLANGQIEIRGEGCDLQQQMVRVVGMTFPCTAAEAERQGLYVPAVYAGRKLMIVHLESLDGR